MVPGQHRAGEVIEAGRAHLAAVALPIRLGVVAPVPDHRTAVTAGAAHALWPAALAHEGEALGVVQKPREGDQVRSSHDGGSSSREPVGYSRSSHHTRCPPNALPRPTTPKPDKSQKSLVSVSSPILACNVFTSTAGVAGSDLGSEPNTSAAPSKS